MAQETDITRRKTVAIAGATGFIGSALCTKLSASFNVVALSRSPQKFLTTLFGEAVICMILHMHPGSQKCRSCSLSRSLDDALCTTPYTV